MRFTNRVNLSPATRSSYVKIRTSSVKTVPHLTGNPPVQFYGPLCSTSRRQCEQQFRRIQLKTKPVTKTECIPLGMEMKRVLRGFVNNSILLPVSFTAVLGYHATLPFMGGGGGALRDIPPPPKKNSCGGNYPTSCTDLNFTQPLRLCRQCSSS